MPFQVIVAKDGHNARDVTLSGRYMPIVLLTKRVRDSLRQNATLREPFLNLLHHMYKALNAEPKLDKAQSRRPDDDDICYFFTHRFPNVQLITSEGGAGFNTNVGVNAACDRNIQIACRLAKCLKLSTKAAPYKKRIHPSQIIATYIAVLLHELAHCLLVWWSRGNCHTPDLGPLLRESGCFIEEAFLGGVLEGWWAKNREGQFKYLRKIVIETRSGRFLELDHISATVFYKRFNASTIFCSACR